jgi:arginine/lysine/ornithine decarboxylase
MHIQDHPRDGPTIYATQSTHKLLAALSQATFIHVRDGRAVIPHGVFNEAYQLHTTTSPLYAISAR